MSSPDRDFFWFATAFQDDECFVVKNEELQIPLYELLSCCQEASKVGVPFRCKECGACYVPRWVIKRLREARV